MIISKAEVIICSPGRNYVTLKLTDENGLVGYGDATLNGRELSVKSYLEDHICQLVVGWSYFDTEKLWKYLNIGTYWKNGAVGITAIGAVDIACWDLKAKSLDLPLYQLIGGKSRNKLLTYAHANGFDVADTIDKIRKRIEEGCKAIRVQSAIPGLDSNYGATKNKSYEPAKRGKLPDVEIWSSSKYIQFIPQLFAKVRKEFGQDILLLHDVHHRLSPIEASRLAEALNEINLFWLEDVCPVDDHNTLKLVRERSETPVAIGEVFNTIHQAQPLLENRRIDYLRMAITHGGGITPMLKIAHLAELYDVKMACHGPSDISPIGMAASIHFGTAIANFGIQEHMGYPSSTMEVFESQYSIKEGCLFPSDDPGLGATIHEEMVQKYPYEQAYLPVCELEDGSVSHW